jgi:hypothetical protein
MAQNQTRQRSARPRSGASSRNGSRPSATSADRLKARASQAADTLGPIAHKSAKPAMAAGAALAGLATGAALASRGRGRIGDVAVAASPLTSRGGTSRMLLSATRELHATACTLTDLATEIRKVRELAEAGRSRSPIEVVLQGLTRRPEQ